MKKYAVLFLLLSSCAAVGTASKVDINENFPHDEIQKIAVIMFETSVDVEKRNMLSSTMSITANAGEILASMTARELAKWGKYIVVNRKAIEEELKLKEPLFSSHFSFFRHIHDFQLSIFRLTARSCPCALK